MTTETDTSDIEALCAVTDLYADHMEARAIELIGTTSFEVINDYRNAAINLRQIATVTRHLALMPQLVEADLLKPNLAS